ncbi:MAG: hypothetical protein JWQ28_18 [Pedobacter sp.]|nr:hypothetical protein [Pedobacter sp.]
MSRLLIQILASRSRLPTTSISSGELLIYKLPGTVIGLFFVGIGNEI